MLDPEIAESISAALMRICAQNSFFGALVLHAHLRPSREIPTAATDGKDIFVNNDFFATLTPAEREAVLLHEVLHAALQHVQRRSGRNPQLWNVAADIVINGMLAKAGYQLPASGLRDPQREHLSAEEVYDLLVHDQKPQPQQPEWADLLEQAPGDAGDPQSSQAQDGESSDSQQKASGEGHWQQALEQAKIVGEAAGQGHVPAGMQRELAALAADRLDWRSLLWRYMVRSATDFLGYDRRFVGQRMYLDSLEGEQIRVAVAVDTSGSINQEALTAFLSEIRGVLRSYPHLRCTLYYADSQLYGPHKLTANGPIPPPVGGGGTNFRPFFEAIGQRTRERADVAIYLTDGWGSFPEKAPICPTLWVVTPGGRDSLMFPFGRVVRMVHTGMPRGQPPTGFAGIGRTPRPS